MADQAKKRKNIVYLDTFGEFQYQKETTISKPKRIFVNRNLKMKSVRTIGFDMDHTLAMYDKCEIEGLAYDFTKQKLVSERGYPAEVLELKYEPEFVIRGLIVDKRNGNVLKLDKHQYIGTVYHGKKPLSRELRKQLYTNTRPNLASPDFYSVDTLFSIPEVDLYAELIERFETDGTILGRTFTELFDDIRYCIDKTHRDGTLKTEILADPGRFFHKDPNLAPALDKLIRSGKILFLLTNSRYDYTEAVMSHILNDELQEYPDWKDYFEYILVDSKKPGFFVNDAPIGEISAAGENGGDRRGARKPRRIYSGGDCKKFEELAGFVGEEILYIGDHTFGDILRSKKSSGWRTAMVIEELEHEIQVAERLKGLHEEADKLHELRNELRFQSNLVAEKIDHLRELKLQDYEKRSREELEAIDEQMRHLTDKLSRLESRLTRNLVRIKDVEETIEKGYNPYWGPIFKSGKENSRFGDQVEDYACIYTSRASNFLLYPSNKYFQTMREQMAHERD